MSDHLTDEQVLDLCAPGAEPEPDTREHLVACGPCRDRVDSERWLSERVAKLPDSSDTPRDLWPALRARLAVAQAIGDRPFRHRAALRAAAAVVIFLLGAIAGHWLPHNPASSSRYESDDSLSAAAEVQRTGTAYVEALARFRSASARSEPGAVRQAREVALAAVHGAAFELARLHPEDSTAREILVLARDRRPETEAP